MNKKLNIILLLLIVGLISSISTANAHPILDPSYKIVSHDVTVKQGETATIKAKLFKYYYSLEYFFTGDLLNDALLFFTIQDNDGHVLVVKAAKTDGYWWNPFPRAVCKFNTTNMPKGNHTLNIACLFPEKGVHELVERDYKFNVI